MGYQCGAIVFQSIVRYFGLASAVMSVVCPCPILAAAGLLCYTAHP